MQRLVGRILPWGCAAVVALACFAQSASAATDEEKAAARSLARQGLEAFQEGDAQSAVDYFSRAEALVHSPVHLVYLARAYASLGRLVNAQEAYIRVTREPLSSASPAAFAEASRDAETELAALKPRLAHLTLHVDNPAGGELTVLLDDEVVSSVLIGVAMPVDPGNHKVIARAANAKSATEDFVLKEAQSAEMRLVLEPLPAPTSGVVQSESEAGPTAPGVEQAPTPPYLAYGALGVGALGAGLATYFFLDMQSQLNQRDELCPGGVCPESKRSEVDPLQQGAKDARLYGIISGAVGGAALAAGVVLLLLDDDSPESAQGPRVRPLLGYRSVGLAGAF